MSNTKALLYLLFNPSKAFKGFVNLYWVKYKRLIPYQAGNENYIFYFFVFIGLSHGANLEEIKTALAKEFKNNFPSLIIKNIDLKITTLPKDFEQYQFIRIANACFNQAQGFIRAEFKTPQNIQKNVFFVILCKQVQKY